MRKKVFKNGPAIDAKGERGAALVMVLMISFLLMVAVTALILEASMNTGNVSDATAEEQAYYAAESGIQSVVHVLRGNRPPNPLLDTSKPADDPANLIDYTRAVDPCSSNVTCDPSNPNEVATLSRWLNYNTSFATPRVILGNPATYSPLNGFAYSVSVTDPDNVGDSVTFSSSGTIDGLTAKTFTTGTASVTMGFVPRSSTTITIPAGKASTNFGTFAVSVPTGSVTIPRTRFAINVDFTHPYKTTKVIRGWIEAGEISPTNSTIWILYDSQVHLVTGSVMELTGVTLFEDNTSAPPVLPEGYYRVGYRITSPANLRAGATVVNGTITAPEPIRLMIRSVGFGPRGARKELESVIHKNHFNGLGAPSPLTLIGPPCTPGSLCPTLNAAPGFLFEPGTSNNNVYSGKDKKLKAFLPPIGLTNNPNVQQVLNRITQPPPRKFSGKVVGTVSNIKDELPTWLQSPANLDATLEQLKLVAQASGTYYGPGVTPPANNGTNYGDYATASGITFIDGPLTFSGQGGGILVIKGGITFQGGFDWKGLVIVTGAQGLYRAGGGNGNLLGNLIVAPYNAASLACTPQTVDCFLAPRYEIDGAGTSEIAYDSTNVTSGLTAITNFVKGVAEK